MHAQGYVDRREHLLMIYIIDHQSYDSDIKKEYGFIKMDKMNTYVRTPRGISDYLTGRK